ncbi:hypothetical protein NON00_11550 [Roseomonas sp. GC11]|uniref:hypothetical protein n=1 Tax=Roseomonas sp. GC11 TaxID=2950546 RepID=UPI00210A9149|nr:hypothetical protein [Roseomonas sp. GC11]MCQ4160561.1 hypothetical protein [Roseomonas sp. GC11]
MRRSLAFRDAPSSLLARIMLSISSFSKEKEAKRLSFRLPPSPGTAGRYTEKSFLVLFSKKEHLF